MARTHVILADDVLQAVDDVVGKRGRSRFIEDAAREKLERVALGEALEATSGIARGPAYQRWHDRRKAASWVRRTRRTETTS
ncbi:MAG: hypothetical protein M3O91_10070 [Chloroflexota bacterium]|nr:hypothetical protein [Chloroflexota bacterium]